MSQRKEDVYYFFTHTHSVTDDYDYRAINIKKCKEDTNLRGSPTMY